MFTLVEPCVTDQLVDRPNLGCAMLIAACRDRDLPVGFVAGQAHFLAYLAGLDCETRIGAGTPIETFRELHQAVVGERGPRPHLNGHLVHRLQDVYVQIMRGLLEELRAGGPCSVPIVDDYVERIAATGCQVVGFSVLNGFDSLTRVVRRRLREDLGMTIVAGGPVVTRIRPGDYQETLRREHLDYLVTGPGERILPRLLDCLAEGRRPDGLPNTFFLQDDRVVGFAEAVRQDLDALPFPDFSDVDFDALVSPEKVLPLESARGCSWDRCAFCDHNAGDAERYAPFSIDRVVEILRHLRTTYDCHEFAFHDLELPPGRAGKLSRAIVAAGLGDLGLTAYARFVPGYQNADLWATMRTAGFTMIEWGLESGCQRTLDSMRKGTKVSTASSVLRLAFEAGVANECFLLFGFPGETEEEANETLEFLRRHRSFIARTMSDVMAVRPDSPLGRHPEQWGVYDLSSDGSFQTQAGMGLEKAQAMMRTLRSYELFDPSRYSGERVRSISMVNASRIMYGLLRSHGLMEADALEAALSQGRHDKIFPLVMGKIDQTDGGGEWRPAAIGETPLVNLRMPVAGRLLHEEESRAFSLADGAHSLAEIGAAGDPPAGDDVISTRSAFIVHALASGFGLAFGRRWEP